MEINPRQLIQKVAIIGREHAVAPYLASIEPFESYHTPSGVLDV